ncbi:MAG: toll/interleukin-1 receptor domain-containing protein [Verrucomicrobia bacterium]|nr:toll/interleukin-1 receptor domain-containing protein [Verrucomicrobiota bacterium]
MNVFISHANDGADLARELTRRLRKEGLRVWLAQEEILPGDNWAERISEALNDSQAMVVLVTPEAIRSNHVEWDIGFALGSKAYRHRLLPVLVGDTAQTQFPALPWALERFHFLRLAKPEGLDRLVQEITESLVAVTDLR